MSRDVTLYLDDMIEACSRIRRYTEGLGRAQLVSGTMAHDAVLRNLEVLGEAAKNVPADIRTLGHEIPWRRITGLRDVLAHAYFGIDDDIRVERRGRGRSVLVAAVGRLARTTLNCQSDCCARLTID